MKNYINWAILAPGIIANSMAKAMEGSAENDSRIRLYAVGSRDKERAAEFAKKWGFEKSYGSYEELLADPEVDAVYICNPHAFHYESALACLNAGKHVLCEKPAGCNIGQLNEMIETAQKNNLFFMEAMWAAFNPCIKKVCEFVKNGGIGELKHIESRFCNRLPYDPKGRLWAPELAGGALLDLGIYNIFISTVVNGYNPIKNMTSNVKMYKNIDAWEDVNMTFENGVTANFQCACDRTAGSDTHDAIIFGTEGFITMENFFFAQKAEVHKFKNPWGNENEISQVIEHKFDVNGYEYELIHATDCILNGKTESNVHTFERSRELCTIMDSLRKDWGMVYPFEK